VNCTAFKLSLRRFGLSKGPLLAMCVLSLTVSIFGQGTDTIPESEYADAAPPPVRAMSKGERSQLVTENGVKDRTKLALELMNARLTRAEEFNAKGDFTQMYNELGGFHALMDDTLDFLYGNSKSRDSVLNNFKRFELGLRKFGPRIGVIRREIPTEYDPYLKSLIRYLRDARTKAVEPLFADTVVPSRQT
jgi:hypothetical protein